MTFENGQLNWIAGFIWNIADDVLRDVYVRGKYRDVILPMTVIRRLDAVLEPTKAAVLKLNDQLDEAGVANKEGALCRASGNAFYNISPFTLQNLRNRARQQQLKADFETYLDGFSANVHEILDKFKFRNQIPTLVEADILFMLSNPPYGKSWKTGLERMGGKKDLSDPRFNIQHDGDELRLITRSSDGQLMFLVNKLTKMNHDTPLGSRIAEVHNGSSLKNCELSAGQIREITDLFLQFEETDRSKVFPNAAFGYWKITVERPLRLRVDLSESRRETFRRACLDAGEGPLADAVDRTADRIGPGPHFDFNAVKDAVKSAADEKGTKLTAKRIKLLQTALAEKDEAAEPVIKKKTKKSVEYEPDPDLRDTEQVPLLEEGGVEAFFQREALPHVPDAWIVPDKTRIGYEISFTRHFYKPAPMRTLEAIKADLLDIQAEGEGLLDRIIGERNPA